MTKRMLGWAAVLSICLVAALGGLVVLRVVKRKVHLLIARELHRTVVTAVDAAPDAPQVVPSRSPDFTVPKRLDAWQIIGPGGGGTFYLPTVSPHDPNLVFTTTDMTECYASEDGGHTWRTFNLRGTCREVFDPKLPNRVYALSYGTWRSDDRGHTWSLIYPDPSTVVHYVNDEGEPLLHSAALGYPHGIYSLAVDPDDSNTLYASMEEDLRVSKDGGKTWKVLTGDGIAQQIWIDPNSPRDRRTIFTRRDNMIGTWDGTTYTKRPIQAQVGSFTSGISKSGKVVIYIACDYVVKDGRLMGGGIMSTEDGGQTWRSLNDGLLKLVAKNTFPNFSAIAASEQHPEVVYASFTHFIPAGEDKAYYGVLKTSDGGATWSSVRQEAGVTAPNMHNDWTSARWGPDFADEPLGIGVSATNPDIVYTGDLARVMRSVDGGKNWVGAYTQSNGKGYATTGLDVTTCYGIHFDPFDAKRMFISYTDIGLFRSEDGGESWMSATTKGVPRAWQANTYWVEFDPAVKGKMWAVMTHQHDLPRMREINHWGSQAGGLATSTDGGDSWTTTARGLPTTLAPTHILLDPKSPVNARVLYLTAFGRGIFKSSDGGQSWVSKNTGLPEKEPLTWRMAIGPDGALYVVTIRRSQDGNFGNVNDGWLFRSRNGGDSWERVPLPEGVNGPDGIAVDPRDPNRLYVSAWARYVLYNDGDAPGGGIYATSDGGQHWQNVLTSLQRPWDVTLDPRNPDLVYATGFDASAFRSTDRGKTWSRMGGFNFKDGHRIIPDPADSNLVYITTFGNSVWHGPAAGDPKATEDITGAPPTLRFQTSWKR